LFIISDKQYFKKYDLHASKKNGSNVLTAVVEKAAMQWAVAVKVLCVDFCSVIHQDPCHLRELALMRDYFVQASPPFFTHDVLKKGINIIK